MRFTLDRPTPFTQSGIAIIPATRENLTAWVIVKDIQSRYLEIAETGGQRAPKPGRPITVPVDQPVNAFGNIPKGKIKSLVQRSDVFVSTGKGRTAHLPPGIYARPKRGKRRDGSSGTKGALKLKGAGKKLGGSAARGATTLSFLVALERTASYRPQLGFRANVTKTVRAVIGPTLRASVRDAIATARP
jgi:hypothetical protein